MTGRLSFDAIIATRNRPEALALSIPLLLGQSRKPEKLIVIDSSDDHAPVAAMVAQTTAGHDDVEVIVEHTEKGLTRQRNRGLEHVTADIVFLPDDDSLFFPGTAEAMMALYEADTEQRISAINPADSPTPPPGVLDAAEYQMSDAHKLKARLVRTRAWLGRRARASNPLYYIGGLLLERAPELPLLARFDAIPVEWMTGYRMSFRSHVIKPVGFEPVFGGYALYEDVDASWVAWRQGVVAGTHQGAIYHHRFPSGRGNRYELAAMALANLAFLTAKHATDLGLTAEQTARARKVTQDYARFRTLTATLARLRDPGAKDEVRGLRAAAPVVDRLFTVPRDELGAAYLALKAELKID